MQATSECLSQNDLVRLARDTVSSAELSHFQKHLSGCERCQKLFADYVRQTSGLERNLSKLTLDDIENAGEAFKQEQNHLPVDLELWLGKKGDQLAEQTALFATPCRLGQYEVQGLIAPGGMGEVYRATHVRLKREVAIKVIRRNQQESQVFYENFLREIETLGQLDHPNMVQAFDALEFDGYLFLVMELIDGESLKASASGHRKFSLSEILEIMLALTRAIGHLHDNGYLHLDIKPSNVMVLKDGPAKLIDYGLAMPLDDASQPGVSVFRGTANYMPPEQLKSGSVSKSTDLYGAGKVFTFLLDHCLDSPLGRGQMVVMQSAIQLIHAMSAGNEQVRPSDASDVVKRLEAMLHASETARTKSVLRFLKSPSPITKLACVLLVTILLISIMVLRFAPEHFGGRGVLKDSAWSVLLSGADLVNSIGMPLNVIPAGKIDSEMAIVLGDQGTVLANSIELPAPIYLGVCEVTMDQFQELMGDHKSEYYPEGASQPLLPAESLTIEDAMEFCRRLSNLKEEKQAGRVYRIPTADEWEFACRAGAKTQFAFGDNAWQMNVHAWYNGNAGTPKPVGTKRGNAWGFFDMHGNVSEFVTLDDDDSQAIFESTGTRRWWGYRGGSWAVSAEQSKCRRLNFAADQDQFTAHGSLGFRVACNLLPTSDQTDAVASAETKDTGTGELYTIEIDLRGEPEPAPVNLSNAKLFRESELVHYWTHENLEQWSEIEYRFDLPAPIESVVEFEHLAWVYNENHYPAFDPGCQGTVEVCGDDERWHVIFHSESGALIVDNRVSVLPLLKGSTKVGLRARLFAERKGKYVYYSQFLRRLANQEPHKLQFILRNQTANHQSSHDGVR